MQQAAVASGCRLAQAAITSTVWRQDHNGFTHQDPGFLDVVANKSPSVTRIYLPPDANCLLSVADHCLRSCNYVNMIVADKQPHLQYRDMNAAVKHCTKGAGVWQMGEQRSGQRARPRHGKLWPPDEPRQHSCARLQERGNINTPMEHAIQNQVDRFTLAIDAIDRIPSLSRRGSHARGAVEPAARLPQLRLSARHRHAGGHGLGMAALVISYRDHGPCCWERLMGKRSSHAALAIRLPDAGHPGPVPGDQFPLTGPDPEREQSYRRKIRPQSDGQQRLVAAIEHHSLTIALGPAGTGKTYLAVSAAVAALEAGEVGRIVLTRPAVEAGERLGYLPGDIVDKLAPYLRPLSDALNERLGGRRVKQLMTEGAIEIAPIAYMRGRTLNNAFIVIDEAQNCTYGQIKMLLTRLGWHSTMVVTGDPDQSDLLDGLSGLIEIARRLDPIPEIAVVRLGDGDIVRHPLVAGMLAVL
jgi:phosphate starvation-inducible PhoH-like protein